MTKLGILLLDARIPHFEPGAMGGYIPLLILLHVLHQKVLILAFYWVAAHSKQSQQPLPLMDLTFL